MSNIGYRPTWAEIDLSAFKHNLIHIRKRIGNNTRIMAVVKCDAYGHGLLPIARNLTKLNVDYLGVASIDEAIILRENKVRLPILILGNILGKHINPILRYNLIQTVSDYKLASWLNQKARRTGKIAKVHIKVDTGMGRLGILYMKAMGLIKQIAGLSNLQLDGLFTHFPCADSNPEFTHFQIGLFNHLISDLNKAGIHIPLFHSANSMGIIGYPQSHFNMVRPGLMLYGIYSGPGPAIKIHPVLSLKSRVIYLKRMPCGQGLSYGHSYVTKRETTVGIIPIGYGDGYPRSLSNRADVLIRGKRFRISGAVCMDQIMVDLGDAGIEVGDEVVLIGRQGKLCINAEELAALCGTIPYEIVCGIGSRVPRIYIPARKSA